MSEVSRARQALLFGYTLLQERSEAPVLALAEGGEGLGRECADGCSQSLRQDWAGAPRQHRTHDCDQPAGCWASTAFRSRRQGPLCIDGLLPGGLCARHAVVTLSGSRRALCCVAEEMGQGTPSLRANDQDGDQGVLLGLGPPPWWGCGWLSVPVTDS